MHPYLQYQSVRALHGLAQAKCEVTYLRTEIGCSHQIIWTIAKKIRLKMNLKLRPVSQAPSLQLKRKNPRQVNNPQKYVVGDQVALFANLRNRRKSRAMVQLQKLSPKTKQQATRPKTLQLNMTKAKQQWEEGMERLNSQYNLDCFS